MMGKNIDIISHTRCDSSPIKNEYECQPRVPQKRLFRNRGKSSHSGASKAIKGDSTTANRKKACIPVLIEAPVKHEMAIVKKRIIFLKQNIMKDLFLGHAFTYPFTGLAELLTHRVYWGPLLIFGGCYICVFIIVAIVYYIVVIPMVIAWAMVTLGPLGVILGHIQWILQTNAITSIICRNIVLTHLGNQVFDITLYLNGQTDFLKRAKFVQGNNKQGVCPRKGLSMPWKVAIPLWLFHCLRKMTILAFLTSISLIPLLGPIVANQLLSGRRAFSYMGRYFALKGQSAKENKDFQYEHLGLFFTFGMAAGLLEFVPLFSVITITSNTIGAAKWSIDLIEKAQNQPKKLIT